MALKNTVPGPRLTARREELILAGLYLSKYDSAGLRVLGFESFNEAFNVIGYALGSRPATIKNYRDEFDPLHSNPRKGWHKRRVRDYCLRVYEEYGNLDLESFAGLVKTILGYDQNAWSEFYGDDGSDDESHFAKRLITGAAAERYFESIWAELPDFSGYVLKNTTRFGCGYDFRLQCADQDFLAVEVKGLRERAGSVLMTPKEYDVAAKLRSRFYLFVVKNFQESPYHEIIPDPLSGRLQFRKHKVATVRTSWSTSL